MWYSKYIEKEPTQANTVRLFVVVQRGFGCTLMSKPVKLFSIAF